MLFWFLIPDIILLSKTKCFFPFPYVAVGSSIFEFIGHIWYSKKWSQKFFSPAACIEQPRPIQAPSGEGLWLSLSLLHSHFKEDRAIIPTDYSHRSQRLLKFVCHGFYPDSLQNELLMNGPIVLAFTGEVQKANQCLSSKEVFKGWLVTMGSTDKVFISLSVSGFAFIIKWAK